MNIQRIKAAKGEELVVLYAAHYEALIDAHDHTLAMAAHERGEDPGLTDAEMDAYLAAPSPLAFWRKKRALSQAALASKALDVQSLAKKWTRRPSSRPASLTRCLPHAGTARARSSWFAVPWLFLAVPGRSETIENVWQQTEFIAKARQRRAIWCFAADQQTRAATASATVPLAAMADSPTQ